uniref:Si:ch211-119d14.3 n=1 Tax=Nothobranchius furzeri TaxID=105023 RepID=A0A1A8A5J1_NOTFU
MKRASLQCKTKQWDPDSKGFRLCSEHFISGKKSDHPLSPDYIPSIFKHVSSPEKKRRRRQLDLFIRRQKSRRQRREQAKSASATISHSSQLLIQQDSCEDGILQPPAADHAEEAPVKELTQNEVESTHDSSHPETTHLRKQIIHTPDQKVAQRTLRCLLTTIRRRRKLLVIKNGHRAAAFFKPTTRSKVMFHLESHFRRAHIVGEFTIHRCGLECLKKPHYHCLYCLMPIRSQPNFSRHFSVCQERQKLMVEEQPVALTTGGESMDSLCKMESDDNEIEEKHRVESCTQAASQSAASVRTHSQPSPSKRDKMIQTNIEKPQDCDEFYFMGLVKLFKKLSPNKKAEVRMKMERILFEAEFI